jgi:N-terminal domain of M60-like peptidases/Peptidase M60, enhancin and enhancin-like/Concanavalin A-like lectin/glucanases superfamily
MQQHHYFLRSVFGIFLLGTCAACACGVVSGAPLADAGSPTCGYAYPTPSVTGCDGVVLTDPQWSSLPDGGIAAVGIAATTTPNGLTGLRFESRQSIKLKNECCVQLGKSGTDFSVSMWVKPTGVSQILSSGITPYGGSGGGFSLASGIVDGRARLSLLTQIASGLEPRRQLDSVLMDLGVWQYVTLTYTTNGPQSLASITVNGATTSGTVAGDPFNDYLEIGDKARFEKIDAVELGDMKSYGRTLTSAEIRAQWLAVAPSIGVTAEALSSAISKLTGHFNGTAPLDANSFEAAAVAMTKSAMFLPTSESLMVAALDLADVYETKVAPLFVSAATLTGISNAPQAGETAAIREARTMLNIFQTIHDEVFRNETVAACSAILQDRRWKTADYFPGKVTAMVDPNKIFAVPVNATVPAVWGHPVAFATGPKIRPTGLYLPPGSIARVTVPAALVNAGFVVQIGAHSVDHTFKENHTRMHRTTRRFDILQQVTSVASPLGGGVYIEVPYLATAGMVNVQVQGVVEAPIFSLRSFDTTTVGDWTARRTAGAPWADFVTDSFMMQVPANYVYAKPDPTQVMKDWDTLMKTFSEFVGIPPEKRNDVVAWFQVDTQIAGGGGSIGYPQVNNDYNPRNIQLGNSQDRLVTAPLACAGFDCHELGHAQLFSNFRGENETMVNMPYAYVVNTKFGYTFDEAFRLSFDSVGTGGHTPDRAAVDWMVTVNFGNAAEMDYSNTTKDEFRYQKRGVGKYADMARLFGWKVLTDFYLRENLDYNAKTPGDGLNGVDSRILRLSVEARADLTPLIHFWGIHPVEPEKLKAALAAKGLGASPAIKELLLRYRTLIPANKMAFDAFFESVFPGMPAGVSPDYGAGWYQVRRTQWNEALALKAAGTIDTLIARYFP